MSAKRPAMVISALLLSLPVAVAALPGDADQEINIQADSWDADRRSGRAVYRGNVIVTSGGVELRGDELVLEFLNDQLQTVVITGAPARFTQAHGDERARTDAEARSLTYETGTAMVRLRGEARVAQGGDEFSSDDIRYNIREERVVAGGEGAGRVQVIIQPRREPPEPEPER
jgi:lipopolysaccharide export system protein LptA